MDEGQLLEEMRIDLEYKEKKIEEQKKLIDELKYQTDVMVNKLKVNEAEGGERLNCYCIGRKH